LNFISIIIGKLFELSKINKYYSQIDGEKLMNYYGENSIPFLFVIDYDIEKIIILKANEIGSSGIQFQFNQINKNPIREQNGLNFQFLPISFEAYKKAFNIVESEIQYGNSFLCNLTALSELNTNLSLEEIYKIAEAKYKLLIPNHLVCFSPETFITIDKNGLLKSNPMKGTIDANLPDAANQLLSNKKELYEHHTIVDLIRNDVGIIAEKVWVSKFRYLERIDKHNGKAILQMSSEICGQLNKSWKNQIGTNLIKMLPAGSICGAPKKRTLEIIQRAENMTYFGKERGFYSGIFGYFDGETLNSAVSIRFIEIIDNKLFFKSGGGITFMSNAQEEYEELLQKIYIPLS